MGNTPPLVVVGIRGAKLRFNVLQRMEHSQSDELQYTVTCGTFVK
jgi:hypothetical protein